MVFNISTGGVGGNGYGGGGAGGSYNNKYYNSRTVFHPNTFFLYQWMYNRPNGGYGNCNGSYANLDQPKSYGGSGGFAGSGFSDPSSGPNSSIVFDPTTSFQPDTDDWCPGAGGGPFGGSIYSLDGTASGIVLTSKVPILGGGGVGVTPRQQFLDWTSFSGPTDGAPGYIELVFLKTTA
jgi:hypothetical protein